MASKPREALAAAYADLAATDTAQAAMNANTDAPPAQTDKERLPSKHRINSKSITDIVNTDYPERIPAVQGMILEGLTLLVGPSKAGKSWFTLNMCLAVADGKPFLNRPTTEGYVLYLALEDYESQLKERTIEIANATGINISPRFECETQNIPTSDNGLIESLRTWIDDHQPCRMIVIDTMQHVRGVQGNGNVYAQDVAFLKPFAQLANEKHVAIVLTHHTNKMKGTGDPYDKISGSTGLMGTADSVILLDRKRDMKEGRLSFVGRGASEFTDKILNFNNGIWSVVSADADAFKERQAYENDVVVRIIRDLLRDNPHGARITYADMQNKAVDEYGQLIGASSKAIAGRVKSRVDDLMLHDDIEVSVGVNIGGTARGISIAPYRKIIEYPQERLSI